MSIRDIEVSIVSAAREVLENRKLRLADLCEWKNGEIVGRDDEVVVTVVTWGTTWWAAFPKAADFRGMPPGTRGRHWPPKKATPL